MMNLYGTPKTTRRSTRKLAVSIVHETKKAKLVKDSKGRQGWIQNRSYKAGKVNLTTFENAVANFTEREELKIEMNKPIVLDIVRETEKAVCFEIVVDYYNAEVVRTKSAWLPKSWLIAGKAKAKDFSSKVKETFGEGAYIVLNAKTV